MSKDGYSGLDTVPFHWSSILNVMYGLYHKLFEGLSLHDKRFAGWWKRLGKRKIDQSAHFFYSVVCGAEPTDPAFRGTRTIPYTMWGWAYCYDPAVFVDHMTEIRCVWIAQWESTRHVSDRSEVRFLVRSLSFAPFCCHTIALLDLTAMRLFHPSQPYWCELITEHSISIN